MSDVGKEIVEAAEAELRAAPRPDNCECFALFQLYGMPVLCRPCDEAMEAAAKAGGWTYGSGV